MKYLRLFNNQESASGKICETPVVASIKNVSEKILYVTDSISDSVKLYKDDNFINYLKPVTFDTTISIDPENSEDIPEGATVIITINEGMDGKTSMLTYGGTIVTRVSENDIVVNEIPYYCWNVFGENYYFSFDFESSESGEYPVNIYSYSDNTVTDVLGGDTIPFTWAKADETCTEQIITISADSTTSTQKAYEKIVTFKIEDENGLLKEFNVPYGLTSVPSGAFSELSNLEVVNLPETVTNIGDSSFYSCSNLKSIDLSNVTSIGQNSFEFCNNLTSVKLSNKLESISYNSFSSCDSLETIDIPASVKRIEGYTFQNCTSLKTVTLHEGLEYIGEAVFDKCKSLENIIIPSTVTNIDRSAFDDCKNLKTITILNPDCVIGTINEDGTLSYTSIFSDYTDNYNCGCTSLETIYFNGDTTNFPWGCNNENLKVEKF